MCKRLSMRNRLAAIMAILCSMTVFTVGTPATATEKPGSSLPVSGLCGSGYQRVDVYPIRVPSSSSSWKYGKPGTITGYVELYWNASQAKNCAVALAAGSTRNVSMYRYLEIWRSSGKYNDDIDAGYFHSYAGPVYTQKQKAHECVGLRSGMNTSSHPQSPGDLDAWGVVSVDHVHCG